MPRSRLLTLSFAVLVGALLVAPVAGAAPSDIASKRAQAQAARVEMQRLGAQLEPAIERYNQAVHELEQVEADIALNRRMIAVTKDNLRVTQGALDEKLEQSYRVGEPDLLASVLSRDSLTEVLAVTDLFEREQRKAGDLIEGLERDRRSLARRQRALDRQEAQARALRAQRADERRAIDRGIAQQQALVAGLEDEIAALIAEEQARQERLRQQALAALEAEQQAAQGAGGDVAIGGSVDGGSAGDGGGASDSGASDASAGDASDGEAAAPAPVDIPATDGSLGAQAVSVAMQFLGTPYVWGGAAPGGFDCSGLTMYAYGQLGIGLSHFTGAQWNEGTRIPYDQMLPGDLVFFHSDLHHMGMYIGGGQMIHAPQTGDVVKISPLMSDFAGAVRPY